MKLFLRILLLFILLNISFIGISYFKPGRIGFVDRYFLFIEKGVIELLEKKGTRSNGRRDQKDPFTSDAISFDELRPYLDQIIPGTLFFSDHGRTVSTRFIKGRWKHCGIYLGTLEQIQAYWGMDHELVQSLRKYYTSEEDYLIFDSSYTCGLAIHNIKELADLGGVSTLRSLLLFENRLNKKEWSTSLLNGMEHLGKDYDYFFVLENDDAFYCSEFLYAMLPLERDLLLPSKSILGREFLLPTDLVHSIQELADSTGGFFSRGTLSKSEGQIINSLVQ